MHDTKKVDLHLFDGEGGAAAPATGGAESAQSTEKLGAPGTPPITLYGVDAKEQPAAAAEGTPQTEPSELSFDDLIKGKYKDDYDKRVKTAIDRRFKAQEQVIARQQVLGPVIDLLAQRYGVDASNPVALATAIENDEALYEEEAAEKGISVEQLKRIKQLERENQSLQRAANEQQRTQNAERIYTDWMKQAGEAKAVYPALDFDGEAQNPDFLRLLRAGVGVRAAYEVIHRDEIIGGAMQFTAQKVAEKVASNVRARGARPQENGAGAQSGAVVRKAHASELNTQDVLELAKRAKRGIKTTFGG